MKREFFPIFLKIGRKTWDGTRSVGISSASQGSTSLPDPASSPHSPHVLHLVLPRKEPGFWRSFDNVLGLADFRLRQGRNHRRNRLVLVKVFDVGVGAGVGPVC